MKQCAIFQRLLRGLLQSKPLSTLGPAQSIPSQPAPDDYEAWRVHWQAQRQPWRTEPEIDTKRQEYLSKRRAISPDMEQGIYPFKDIKLTRADVEWLLTTHENGRGPVDWNDESQRGREGLDVRGADLNEADLSRLPLAKTRFGLTYQERGLKPRRQRRMSAVHLQRANFFQTHLEGATFRRAYLEESAFEFAYLEKADFAGAHLESANFDNALLNGAYLRSTFFDHGTFLNNISLGNEKTGFASLVDIRWNGVNLATIQWQDVKMLGDEERAKQRRSDGGKLKDNYTQILEYNVAARANRQLANELQAQGLNENAARFAYRAQILQRHVFRLQIVQRSITFKQRMQMLGAWFFSWFLFLLAGYGYRLWQSFLVYGLAIIGFATAYYFLGPLNGTSISLVNAIALSMTAFHGRGFFPGVTQLNDTLTILASVEAFFGLVLEVTLIATLTQRFFGK